MIHSDPGRRNEAIARNSVFIRQCADHVKNFFLVMLPREPQRDRKENFDDMVESYTRLMPVLEFHDARIVIEWLTGSRCLVLYARNVPGVPRNARLTRRSLEL